MKKYNDPQIKTVMFNDESIAAAMASMDAFNQWENENGKELTTTDVNFNDAVKLVF